MHLMESNMYRSTINELSKGFSVETKERINSLSDAELHRNLDEMITPPITLVEHSDREMLQLYYTSSYVYLMEYLNVPKDANLFEIAAGDTVFIPKALDAYGEEGAKYVTANLNQNLTGGFREKTAELSIEIQIIEDNGARILNYCDQGSMDVIVFHHALNDIIQTMIAEREGIDTIHCNWWSVEPQMLQAVMDYHNRGELKQAVYSDFISIIETSLQLLKEEGVIIFDNCTYSGYEKIGYSSEFHSNYIQLAREWINEADLGLQEVQVPGFDTKWWMVLQKSH